MSALTEQFAAVIGDAWGGLCETPLRWANASADQRASFRACAAAALQAGRLARGLDPAAQELRIARAINEGFLAGCAPWVRRRYRWEVCLGAYREFYVLLAREVIAAGRAMRQARAAA